QNLAIFLEWGDVNVGIPAIGCDGWVPADGGNNIDSSEEVSVVVRHVPSNSILLQGSLEAQGSIDSYPY
ncbi:MAG: hypothetical protein ABEI78_01150, partial [Candidatus Nanohaloarchaea archaeon]